MIKRVRHLINIILLSTVVLTTGSCDRHGAVWKELDKAESLMDTKPDSALEVLTNIPPSNIKGKEIAARYALLKSIALDKNYIDTTTFDVLQPAIDYYIKNGTPDEQLRTYYYQGRIYQNQGDDDSAMRSFMNACDLRPKVTDSLLLAHTLVAQGVLYFKQYKTSEFIQKNMEAMRIYGAIGKEMLEIKSCANAIDGFIITDDKTAADSLISICISLAKKNQEGESYLFSSLLSYTMTFGKPEEIRAFLDEYQNVEMTKNNAMNFAYGYSKIGEYGKAVKILSKIHIDDSILDSLKLASIEIDILEKQGNYAQALKRYKDYSDMLERYQNDLLSHDLLFADKRHQLEMQSIMEIQFKDRIIFGILCGILGLLLLMGCIYHRFQSNKAKRIIVEKEKESLEIENRRLEAEQRQQELETANLYLEKSQLENERDKLKDLLKEQSELTKPIQGVIKVRLDMLNGLLAKEITRNDSYAKPYNKWIETIRNDKKKFMDSTRLAFTASHPKFMEHLEQHGLSTDEINYLCLYAIGLRGKEVGEYIQIKRHYIISHEIRKKLGIDEHETNIGPYIRRLMKESAR